jgi:hypothetical protein
MDDDPNDTTAELISEKLEQIKQTLDEKVKELKGFSCKSTILQESLGGRALITAMTLTVSKKFPKERFILEAWGDCERGSIVFSFDRRSDAHGSETEVLPDFEVNQIDQEKLNEVFLKFVGWFDKRRT